MFRFFIVEKFKDEMVYDIILLDIYQCLILIFIEKLYYFLIKGWSNGIFWKIVKDSKFIPTREEIFVSYYSTIKACGEYQKKFMLLMVRGIGEGLQIDVN